MNRIAKKVLRKIRGQHPPPKKLEPKWKKYAAKRKAREYQKQFWERDKKIKREANFKKARQGLVKYREFQEAEKERQNEIRETRLKNLKKARKAREQTT